MGGLLSSIFESTEDKMRKIEMKMDELQKLCLGQCSQLEKELRTELDARFRIPEITELSYVSDVRVNCKKDHSNITGIISDICGAVTCKSKDRTKEICKGVQDMIETILGSSSGSETKKKKYQVFFRNGGFYRLDIIIYHYHAQASALFDGTKAENAMGYISRSTLLDMQKANPQVILALIDTQSLKLMEQCLVEANRFYMLLNLVTSKKDQTPADGDISRLVAEQKQLEGWVGVDPNKSVMESYHPSHAAPPAQKGGKKFMAANPMMMQAGAPMQYQAHPMANMLQASRGAVVSPFAAQPAPTEMFTAGLWDGMAQPKTEEAEAQKRTEERIRYKKGAAPEYEVDDTKEPLRNGYQTPSPGNRSPSNSTSGGSVKQSRYRGEAEMGAASKSQYRSEAEYQRRARN